MHFQDRMVFLNRVLFARGFNGNAWKMHTDKWLGNPVETNTTDRLNHILKNVCSGLCGGPLKSPSEGCIICAWYSLGGGKNDRPWCKLPTFKVGNAIAGSWPSENFTKHWNLWRKEENSSGETSSNFRSKGLKQLQMRMATMLTTSGIVFQGQDNHFKICQKRCFPPERNKPT